MKSKDPYRVLRSELVSAAARQDAVSAQLHPSRRRGRSRPLAAMLAALVVTGSAAAAVVSLTESSSEPLTGQVPGRLAPGPQGSWSSTAGYRYSIQVTPALDAGSGGWTASISYVNPRTGRNGAGESTSGGYPTRTNPVFQGTGLNASPGDQGAAQVGFVVTGPGVAAIRFGSRTIRTFTSAQLPSGDRAAVFFVPAGAPLPMIGLSPTPAIQFLRMPAFSGRTMKFEKVPIQPVAALDTDGNTIATKPFSPAGVGATFWQARSAVTPNIHEAPYRGRTHPRPGVCELSQHGLPALTPEWGHTITRITAIRDARGELFLSCLSTEYYLHDSQLNIGLLLDARRPGRSLGRIPGAQPVHGSPDLVSDNSAELSAKRIGNAWLVVQGGSGQSQRLEVLGALGIGKLDLH